MMQRHSRIYIPGHRGLVGSALQRYLAHQGFGNILTTPRSELDLRDQGAVGQWFDQHQPEYVFLAAAKVGGILANSTYPVDFLQDNLQIQINVIHHSYRTGVKKLLFLGSSCIYPKFAPQPIKEEYLLTGALESTNEWYAIAKIAGIKLCQAYRQQYGWSAICAMPTNLYGLGDNFNLQNSHVLPALIRKFHEAKIHQHPQVTIWGTGTPRREFLYVEDLADACVFLMQNYDQPEIINVGTGEDLSISELANLIQKITEYPGELLYDPSKPDGTPRKLLDVSRIHHLGWQAQTPLPRGIQKTYDWYVTHAQGN
ncbi:GDP-fucose synthetase [Gloeomargarita lithophora Alchichica-D10]|uniref:GDP-L-fucose synthase n=2 Tax=Gloeomargarita TaxID=1188227 RepID=A0A1J0ABI9_9CYAN|nr:GDP-L-fucose synthase [Gloeomargarita lithophora]APB33299.1 GDP-fucose synthetase [Gloeomargarita lithophora Alchichica-D10]